MKKALINAICELMNHDANTYMFTADLGYGVMDRIIKEYPKQFINAGICEQNMASAAAGMALEGNTVFMYSIGNFPSLRCLEQIRNDIAYHHANVKIVAVGGGFAYGNLGMSHHATEDIAMLRAIPNMTIFSPADPYEAAEAVRAAAEIDGPVYIRLGRGGEPAIPHLTNNIKKITPVYSHSVDKRLNSIAIFGTGAVVKDIIEAANEMKAKANITCFSVPAIKPIDISGITDVLQKNDSVITVEEHTTTGGLGTAIAEIIVEKQLKNRLKKIGMQDQFTSIVGSPEFLRKSYGLNCEGIIQIIQELIGATL